MKPQCISEYHEERAAKWPSNDPHFCTRKCAAEVALMSKGESTWCHVKDMWIDWRDATEHRDVCVPCATGDGWDEVSPQEASCVKANILSGLPE